MASGTMLPMLKKAIKTPIIATRKRLALIAVILRDLLDILSYYYSTDWGKSKDEVWYNRGMEKVTIEKLVPGGQGIGTLADGRKIFLWNVLPGEVVSEYRVTKKKSHYLEGVATKIEVASKERVEPRDECYLATSPWQMMRYEYELKQKCELVKEVFRQNEIQSVCFGDASSRLSLQGSSLLSLPSSRKLQNTHDRISNEMSCLTNEQSYFYRNKMEYSLFYDKEAGKIRLAFHERGSHRKVPITQSSIERPEIWAKACEIVDDLNARGEEARKYQSLLLRCNREGKVSGGLFENGQPHPVFPNLTDEILGVPYSYSPNGFFQINLPVYEMALMEIKKFVGTEKVLDLYAGVGTIGLSVARDKGLTLVECNKSAYEEALNNTKELKNVMTILANSEDALEYIEPDETVIVDPPRAGCDKKLIERFLEVKPRRIIYLSCNPATQARDVKMLLDKYIIKSIKTFNFFPRTPHIENLVVLDISPDE